MFSGNDRLARIVGGIVVGVSVVAAATMLNHSPLPSSRLGAVNASSGTTTSTAPPSPVVTRSPALEVSPTAAATPTPTFPVSLSLTSLDRTTANDGVILAIAVDNNQQQALSFAFDPSRDVTLRDARGNAWPQEWAEYSGNPSVPGDGSSQLVRALFNGEVANGASWPLTIDVQHIPGVADAQWKVSPNDAPPLAAQQSAPPQPPAAASTGGPVSLEALGPVASSAQAGIQVDLELNNQLSTDLTFPFDPSKQIVATDDLGRPYNVTWAQYDGVVSVQSQSSARLARVFLSGPVNDGHPSWMRVVVSGIPGTGPLTASFSL